MSRNRVLWALAAPVAAIVIALTVTSLVLILTGNSPIDTYQAMWSFGTTRESVTQIFNRATPIYISAIAAAVAFRMNLFNIGVDGQYRLAALVAASVGAAVTLPPVFHVPLIIVVAMVVGAGWSGIAGVLLVKRNVNVVISTIMLNSIATGLAAYLLNTYWREASDGTSTITRTPPLPDSAHIPKLNRVINWLGSPFDFELDPVRADVFGSVILAVLVGVVIYVLMFRTRFGFELRATGVNAAAARAAGVDPGAMVIRTMLISGAIAGLVGIPQLLGEFFEFRSTFPSLLGFNGIGVALLGRNHPIGIAFGAFLWGFLEQASAGLSLEGITPEISNIMKGTVLLSVVVAYEVVNRRQAAAQVEAVAAELRARTDDEATPAGASA